MSLINKMLQDLDARGSQGDAALQDDVRPVPKSDSRLPVPVVLVGALSALSLAVGGYFALQFYQKRQAAPTVVVKAAPPVLAPAPVVVPAQVAAPAPLPAPVPTAAPVAPEPAPAAKTDAAPESADVKPNEAAPKQAKAAAPSPAPRVQEAPAARQARPERSVATAAVDGVTPAGTASRPGNDVRTRAENEYRRALASMAEGRVSDTLAMLEQTLRIDPRHDGARQTIVGLLVENGRHDEAIGHLEATLAADVRQPSLALLLARLQIERGGDGIDTLMRSLPAAAGKPDYHAFLAGALARAGRHREAAEQYGAALRISPNNGVWLMGLGIALQGDGRDAEALAAYQRAGATGTLSPELQAFVERKINALGK